MTTYTFKVTVEPDDGRWHAVCPALADLGAVSWGETRAEALTHIREVVEMVVAELVEEGRPIPGAAQVSDEALVAVAV